MCEYIPGMRESLTLAGRGLSHRSGTHSKASGPQIAVLRLAPTIDTVTTVFFGTKISVSCFPSFPVIGNAKGRMVSSNALIKRDSKKAFAPQNGTIRTLGQYTMRAGTCQIVKHRNEPF